MGLDMYVFATRQTKLPKVDFGQPDRVRELHYWRKHPNLHGWMQRLYIDKGGQNDEFNLAPVVLDSDDLNRLEIAILHDQLPITDGFFFGRSDGSERDVDLLFVAKARKAISRGMTVFYVAWW